MKNRINSTLVLLALTGTMHAQWTVKESDFVGSALEELHRVSPHLVYVMPDEEWDKSNFASKEEMKWYEDARYGMYLHFGLGAYRNLELSWGMADGVAPDMNKGSVPMSEWTTWPNHLTLEKFSKKEFVDILRKSGMKYVMLVTKHHDGFHLYDTRYSDFKITKTPYGKDFVREIVDACHQAGVKVGFYFSQRDWYHPDYEPIDTTTIDRIGPAPYYKAKEGKTIVPGKKHARYLEYMFNTVRELCTNYGKIDMFNFDAAHWNGMFTADMWDAERLTRMIRELQPGIIINNRTSVPGDYDSPEQRIGMYQDYRMWETCMCLCDTWSYSPTRVKSAEELFRNIQSAAAGNGNVLLSWGMKWDGDWDATQKKSITGVGKLLEKYGKSIYKTHGGPWLPDNWGGSTFRGDKVYVHVFNTGEGPIVLPKLPEVDMKLQRVLTGQRIAFADKGSRYEIDCHSVNENGQPFIIELKASRPLSSTDILRKQDNRGVFADTKTYGRLLQSCLYHSGEDYVVRLETPKIIKGIQLQNAPEDTGKEFTVLLSEDGQNWSKHETGSLTDSHCEIPVTAYVAGILKEGVQAKIVKIQFTSAPKGDLTIRCYGE